jgi:hypothetical protein
VNPAIPNAAERIETAGANLVRLIPGIVLLTAIGYAGKLTQQLLAAYGKAHHTWTFANG